MTPTSRITPSRRRLGFHALALAALTLAAPLASQAQTWPSKPLRLVVSFPPGAPGDMIARQIQPLLQQSLGQTVVVDNKPGAGGNIGAQEVARSNDGHTFLVGPDTMVTINPHLYKKLSFSPTEDLQAVTLLAGFNQMLVCHPSTGAKNVQELLAANRKAKMNYASGGPGVPGHMAMEMLLNATGSDMVHVPYRGPAPASQDVLAGAVPCGFLATPVVGPFVKDGRLNGLAVSGSRRSAANPQVPTVAESGVAGFDASFFETLMAPKGTPTAVVERLQHEVARALADPKTQAALKAADLEPLGVSSAEASSRLKADHEKWRAINAKVQLQLD
jgi:tripartite-type tricarboxylate transporter receptor subunit TctC